MTTYLKKIIAGIAIGIANIIPGVSGGTIAVVFGVYSELIDLASIDLKKIKNNWQNFLFLCAGIAMGIIGFAKVFKILYSKFPVQINFFFIGLIIGSIFLIFDMVKEREPSKIKKMTEIIKAFWFLIGLGLMLAIFFTKSPEKTSGAIITDLNFTTSAVLFFAGIAGSIAMLIPGISGSFLLLIMGVYHTVIKSISDFNIVFLMIVGVGALVGFIFGAKFIKLLMSKYPKITYSFILGLVVGSIVYLYPQVCQPLKMRIISAVCLFAGYGLINIFEKKQKNGVSFES